YELAGDTLTLLLPAPLQGGERVPAPKHGEVPAAAVYTLERDGKTPKEQAQALLKTHTEALDNTPFAAKGGPGGPAGPANGFGAAGTSTQKMLQRILDRLDRIDQRLDALEKKMAAPRDSK